jgi:hypothetical protein
LRRQFEGECSDEEDESCHFKHYVGCGGIVPCAKSESFAALGDDEGRSEGSREIRQKARAPPGG